MLDFFNRFFKPAPPSGATAKERLRLVLLSDHLSLAPDVVESLKRDLLAVISRYVEIDQAHADVTFEHRQNEVAMLASIPITGVRERQRNDPPARPPAAVALAVTEGPPGPALGALSEATRSEAVAVSGGPSEPVLGALSEATVSEEAAATESPSRSAGEASVVAALALTDSVAPGAPSAVDDNLGVVSASEVAPADGLGKPAIMAISGTASRRRRRRKSAAAKRAAQQTMQLNQPAQA